MTPIEQLNDLLTSRYACKDFDSSKKLSAEDKDALLKSLPLTPSSFGLQLWKFFIVEDPATKERLKEVSWGQQQVTDCDFHVVFAFETEIDDARIDKWVNLMGEIQSTPEDKLGWYSDTIKQFLSSWSEEQKHAWAKNQTYIALGQFMAAAALLKIDTTPMEGIDHAAYDEILGLKEKGYATSVTCSVGYRSSEDKHASTPTARFPYDDMVEVI